MSTDAVGARIIADAAPRSAKPAAGGSDERLSPRRAAMWWIASAATGWLVTVGVVWAVAQAI